MPDRNWRDSIKSAAVVWLFRSGPTDVAMAVWRSRIVGVTRLDSGQIGLKLEADSEQDAALLTASTRSWTDADMPGPLDLAFERALPGGEWPVFAFTVVDDAPPREATG